MAKAKEKKKEEKEKYYYEPNHAYFSKHFEELVLKHGGKWIVLIKAPTAFKVRDPSKGKSRNYANPDLKFCVQS